MKYIDILAYLDTYCTHLTVQIRDFMTHQTSFLTPTPPLEIHNCWLTTTSCNDPDNLFVAVIYLLMFAIRRYEGKVSRCQILALAAAFRDDTTVPRLRVDNGVLLAVMMHSRRSVRLRYHDFHTPKCQHHLNRFGAKLTHTRRTQLLALPSDCSLSDHAFCLPRLCI